ncbi:predicted protein [Chaetoceros tenuissimus]|uniref:Uncharacterized protein n=1 Tax=Chaetoceros tenuissimus TaxID=426638 RepID=A0AAD3CJK1_9STRA|nr:predicted protein [Chaetoceros tenuissimus]
MSSKLLKQIIAGGDDLDAITNPSSKEMKKRKRLQSKQSQNQSENDDEVKKSVVDLQVESMLFFDKAFADRRTGSNTSMERRKKLLAKKKVSKSLTNTRSSSSAYARKAPIPTFNKKRAAKEKKIKDLEKLARLLKKSRSK